MPLTYVVPRWNMECMYDKLDTKEFVSISIFIAHGSRLAAKISLEGPVAPPEANTAKELNDYLTKYRTGKRYGIKTEGFGTPMDVDKTGTLKVEEEVDFEQGEYEREEEEEDDDDDEAWDDDNKGKQFARRIEKSKKKASYVKPMREGEPYERTSQVSSPGWYRFCVQANHDEISVEIEMRKSSELGEP